MIPNFLRALDRGGAGGGRIVRARSDGGLRWADAGRPETVRRERDTGPVWNRRLHAGTG